MRSITYLSLGAGVQSSALYVMSCLELRDCPRAEVAIFADTQSEPAWVYEQVEALRAWGGIPVETVTAGNLGQDIIDRHNGTRRRCAAIPAYSPDPNGGREAHLRRQCTREYKIEPIRKRVRELLGLKPRQRAVGKVFAQALIGISLDEAQRAKMSREPWITNVYPLLDAGMRKGDCLRLLEEYGLPAPLKSACVFCPYHDNRYWRSLKGEHPEEWERAVSFDVAFRDMSRSGLSRPVYLHRSCRPLGDVDFDSQGELLWDSFTEECEGMCGV